MISPGASPLTSHPCALPLHSAPPPTAGDPDFPFMMGLEAGPQDIHPCTGVSRIVSGYLLASAGLEQCSVGFRPEGHKYGHMVGR